MSDNSIEAADIPLKWFALEVLLEEMAQSLQRGILSKQECLTVAKNKLHFEENALEAAIQYLDQLSVLLHYPDILPNVVFSNPQVLLDKISELVFKSVEIEKLSKEQALSGEWRKFHEFALVTVNFLSQETFSKHYVPGLFEAKDLVLLFKKLLVFAPFSDSEYFVPALLRILGSEEVVKVHRVSSSSDIPDPLITTFPAGAPRPGIFCSLNCFLTSHDNDGSTPWSILNDEVKSPVCLYRNCVQFEIPNLPVTITLIDDFTHFEVHADILCNTSDKVLSTVCQTIKRKIFKGIQEASQGMDDVSPIPTLLCPCGKGESQRHIANTNLNLGLWICTLDKRVCGELTPKQMLWVQQDEGV